MYSSKAPRPAPAPVGPCANCDHMRVAYEQADATLDAIRIRSAMLKQALATFEAAMHSLGEKALRKEIETEDVQNVDRRFVELKKHAASVLEVIK